MKVSKYCMYLLLMITILLFVVLLNASTLSKNLLSGQLISITNNEELDIDTIEKVASDCDVTIFTRSSKIVSTQKTEITYYTNSNDMKQLMDFIGIREGVVRSTIFADIYIEYKQFHELDITKTISSWGLIGNEEQCNDFIKDLSQINGYAVSKLTPTSKSIDMYIPYLLYVILIAVMLLSSYIDAIFQKKEIAVRVLHGDTALRYYKKNICTDTIAYTVIYFVLYNAILKYTAVMAWYKNITWMLLLLCLLNCLMYIPILNFNSREIIYGHQHTKKLSSIMFAIKAASAVIISVMMTLICLILPEITRYNKASDFFKSKNNYMLLTFLNNNENINNNFELLMENKNKRLTAVNNFINHRTSNSICIANISKDLDTMSEQNAIYCNYRALSYLKSIIPEIKEQDLLTKDCLILIPKTMNAEQEKRAFDCLLNEFEQIENYRPNDTQVEKIKYHSKDQVLSLFVDGNVQFSYLDDPIICIASDTISKYNIEPNYYILSDRMLYGIDNVEQTKIFFDNSPVKVVGINAYEQYKADLNSYVSLIIASGILSLLMIVFHISVTSILIRLEYELNAKEFALKKIIGYSIFRKNKKLFIKSVAVFTLILIVEVIYAITSQSISTGIAIILSLLLFVLDLLLLSYQIIRIERKQLIKILKGGAL